MSKKSIPAKVLQYVLLNSRRKCCVCFAHGMAAPQLGEVCHLVAGAANDSAGNLAYLCSNHAVSLDRGDLLPNEVRKARDELYKKHGVVVELDQELGNADQAYERHAAGVLTKHFARIFESCPFSSLQSAVLVGTSGATRQIDLVFDVDILSVTIRLVFEVKYQQRDLLSAKTIDSFATVAKDVFADKAIVVTNGKVSETAMRIARSNGIGIIRITEDGAAIETIVSGHDNVPSLLD